MTASVEIPRYYQFHWPIIVALRELGDSATIEELNSRVITDGGYTEQQQAVLHNDGPNRKSSTDSPGGGVPQRDGVSDKLREGVWNLTDKGRTVTEPELEPLRKEYLSRARKAGSRPVLPVPRPKRG